jgi:formate/nitrite transporter FocA (FNT family)
VATKGIGAAFLRAVDEGEVRLGRTPAQLFATGAVGGIDVGVGVFALFIVTEQTGSHLLASLFFTIGFIALTLGRSELFTENFLVPVATVTAGKRGWPSVARLWAGSLVGNLAGGFVIAAVVVTGFPQLERDAVDIGTHFTELGIGWRSFAMALLAGVIITLMTWMEHNHESTPGHIIAAVAAGWALAYGELNHVIVASIEMFAALQFGAPFGYLDWLAVFGWAALGNMVGGLGLVTMLRLFQVQGGSAKEPDHDPEDND